MPSTAVSLSLTSLPELHEGQPGDRAAQVWSVLTDRKEPEGREKRDN